MAGTGARDGSAQSAVSVRSERENKQEKVARLTGLEPATPGVTGRYSNQLSYNRAGPFRAEMYPARAGMPVFGAVVQRWRG